jgi:hypothetical protein
VYKAPKRPDNFISRRLRQLSGGVIVDWPDRVLHAFNMADITRPTPGRLIVSVVYGQIDALADCLRKLERTFGRVQFETEDIPFTGEFRHREEMGANLQRRFFSFEQMIDRDRITDTKKACRRIEQQFADQVDDFYFRAVNVDPGIMTPDNVLMVSYRETHYRIYLGRGVFGQLELVYSRGRFVALPWTNEDYCHENAVEFFNRVRESLDPANMEELDARSKEQASLQTDEVGFRDF